MPKNALGIMDVSDGTVKRIEKVKNFQVPEDGAGFIAYLLEPKPEEKKADDKGSQAVKEPAMVPTEGQPIPSPPVASPAASPSASPAASPSAAPSEFASERDCCKAASATVEEKGVWQRSGFAKYRKRRRAQTQRCAGLHVE